MSRSRALAVITAAALTAALAPAALASAAAPAKEDRARAEHDRIVAYWTPERMKAAKPRDFVRQKDGSFTLAPTPKAKGKPGGVVVVQPDPVYPLPGPSTGKPWPSEDTLEDQRTGKVFFTSGVSGYYCSGAVAQDGAAGGRALVLTAAHCLYDESKYRRRAPDAGFVSNFLFVPDYVPGDAFLTSCGQTNQGCWTAEALVVHNKYASAGGFNSTAIRFDFGFAVVSGKAELDSVSRGAFPVTTIQGGPAPEETLLALGYPAGKPYDGGVLTYCEGPIGQDARQFDATWSMACDMTGGSSGGPWLKAGALSSLNSYGYSEEPYMYGPKFNLDTDAVYNAARQLAAGAQTPMNTRVG